MLVPGSCSTGAAWRPVIAVWDGQFRCITTSLLGYGGTAERRSARDLLFHTRPRWWNQSSAGPAAAFIWSVIRLGGLMASPVALAEPCPADESHDRRGASRRSVRDRGEPEHYRAFRDMTDAYFADFAGGNTEPSQP